MGGSGKPAKWGYDDVRSLISEHLGLAKAEEPDLCVVNGVLSSDGKRRDSVRQRTASTVRDLGGGGV